jgi:hypothetical protein
MHHTQGNLLKQQHFLPWAAPQRGKHTKLSGVCGNIAVTVDLQAPPSAFCGGDGDK